MPTALTIAGSDPSAGAGIQADLKTFAAHDVYGLTVLTAVTAQNTLGVQAVQALPASLVAAQIAAVTDDFAVDAVKTGMLGAREVVAAVCDALGRLAGPPVVVDPVMAATSGERLLDDDAVELVRTRLLPLARVVTPNRREAEVLAEMPIETPEAAVEASRRIRALGAAAVVLTGWEHEGAEAVDLLDEGGALTRLHGPRLESRHTHGTGCTFAAAIAAGLARRRPLAEAVLAAKRYVELAIQAAPGLGRGHGPLGHFGGT